MEFNSGFKVLKITNTTSQLIVVYHDKFSLQAVSYLENLGAIFKRFPQVWSLTWFYSWCQQIASRLEEKKTSWKLWYRRSNFCILGVSICCNIKKQVNITKLLVLPVVYDCLR